jgi:Flp pilus assembly pilin Flp
MKGAMIVKPWLKDFFQSEDGLANVELTVWILAIAIIILIKFEGEISAALKSIYSILETKINAVL